MTRLPHPDPATMSAPVATALEGMPGLSLFPMVAHAEGAFGPWLGYAAALLADLELDDRRRELAILEVARLSPSRYEWVQHEPLARTVGVTQAEVAAIERGDLDALHGDAHAVVRFTREAVADARVGDEALALVREHLSPREVVELLLVVGQYMAIARITETCGLSLDAPAQVEDVVAGAERGARGPGGS